MQSRPWTSQVINSSNNVSSEKIPEKIIYKWEGARSGHITFFLADLQSLSGGHFYIRKDSDSQVSTFSFTKKLPNDPEQINRIMNVFAELSENNMAIPDPLGICLDFFCHMKVQFPTFDRIPGLLYEFNQGNYDNALGIFTSMQQHSYHDLIWKFCQGLDSVLNGERKWIGKFELGKFNNKELIKWYEAIDESNPHYRQAQFRLFFLYSKSYGCSPNNVEKKKLFDLALKSGDKDLIHFTGCCVAGRIEFAEYIAILTQKHDALKWKQVNAGQDKVNPDISIFAQKKIADECLSNVNEIKAKL